MNSVPLYNYNIFLFSHIYSHSSTIQTLHFSFLQLISSAYVNFTATHQKKKKKLQNNKAALRMRDKCVTHTQIGEMSNFSHNRWFDFHKTTYTA